MSKFPQWALVPDIRPWRGDFRRDRTPYALSGGISLSCYGHMQTAARVLRSRGIACYIELLE